jgi:hypothetical protein
MFLIMIVGKEMKNKLVVKSNSFNPDIDLFFNKKTNLYIDFLTHTNKNEVNILWLCEPDSISNLKKYLPSYANNYDYILTHDEHVLNNYKNSILHLQASTWIEDKLYEPKKESISMVVGGKIMAPGHLLRQKIWFKQEKIDKREFFVSSFSQPENTFSNKILEPNSKENLFFSQFHIAVENCSVKNYFSEKILDCFIAKTVPFYWGCTNIEDFFNDKGIIRFDSVNDLIKKCNSINENTYKEMIPFINENYERAKKYNDWIKNLKTTLLKIKI